MCVIYDVGGGSIFTVIRIRVNDDLMESVSTGGGIE